MSMQQECGLSLKGRRRRRRNKRKKKIYGSEGNQIVPTSLQEVELQWTNPEPVTREARVSFMNQSYYVRNYYILTMQLG
jgi:hypothetical protein